MFDEAFKKLMDLEGWGTVTNDPADSGGLTKYGISQKAYPMLDIRALTLAEAKEIYRLDYWQPSGAWRIRDKGLAIKLFCTAVVMGVNQSGRHLQEACNVLWAGLVVDGNIGPTTAGWINAYRHPAAIESAFEVFAGHYMIRLKQPRFLSGWLIRIDKDMS